MPEFTWTGDDIWNTKYECGKECEFPCEALSALFKVYADLRTEEKTELIRKLRAELNIIDFEVADDLQLLGEKIIQAMPELYVIRDFDAKIGYVRSYEAKRDKGRQVNADCRKVIGTYTACSLWSAIERQEVIC